MPLRGADLERARALPLLAAASDATFQAIAASAFVQKYPAHTILLLEGEPPDFLFILLNGLVDLIGAWNDKETSIALLKPPSAFLLAAVVQDAEALMSAETLERSEVLMIAREAVTSAMNVDVAFAVAVAGELAQGYRDLVRSVKNQKLRAGAERLANYLVSEAERQGGGDSLTLPHGKRLLASLLGMTPEHLSRAFAGLADYGVAVHGAQVVLERPRALRRLAKPTPYIDGQAVARAD